MHVYIMQTSYDFTPKPCFQSPEPVKFIINEFPKQQSRKNTHTMTISSCQMFVEKFRYKRGLRSDFELTW